MNTELRLVSATRKNRHDFWNSTLLGSSLSLFRTELLPELVIQFDNGGESRKAEGLSSYYNRVIDATPPNVNLLFVHDDVFLHDVFIVERLREAFRQFDIVGLAGSRSTDLSQPSWALEFDPETLLPLGWQKHAEFAGAVSHQLQPSVDGRIPVPEIGIYGPITAACTLLDGLFLAVRTGAIKKHDLHFDPRFDFHHYDIDFCRQALEKGVALGTWPILATHGSGGAFGTEAFRTSARTYLAKWNAHEFEGAITKPIPFEKPPT